MRQHTPLRADWRTDFESHFGLIPLTLAMSCDLPVDPAKQGGDHVPLHFAIRRFPTRLRKSRAEASHKNCVTFGAWRPRCYCLAKARSLAPLRRSKIMRLLKACDFFASE